MRDVWLIFVSIFAAGIVSLLLELSLLREFIYIFGSTAASNALIISVFLVGLAVGAYLGTGKRLHVIDETDARRKYGVIQLLNILFVVAFCMTKKYFIYDCPYPNAVRLYLSPLFLRPRCCQALLMRSVLRSCTGVVRNSLPTFTPSAPSEAFLEDSPMESFSSRCGAYGQLTSWQWFSLQ